MHAKTFKELETRFGTMVSGGKIFHEYNHSIFRKVFDRTLVVYSYHWTVPEIRAKMINPSQWFSCKIGSQYFLFRTVKSGDKAKKLAQDLAKYFPLTFHAVG